MTDPAAGKELLRRGPRRPAANGAVEQGDDRRGQLAGARRRLRAGDGVRLPDRGRVGQLRPARDQPGDHPRLRRHAAAAAPGGRGEGARDEPARRADLGAAGLRAGARQRGRPGSRAVRHRARLGAQAGRPGAGGGRAGEEGLGERRSGSGDRGREGRLRDRVRLRGRARGDRRLPRQAQASGAGSSGAGRRGQSPGGRFASLPRTVRL